MVDGLTIKIEGIAELQSKFQILDSEIQSILSKAVSQGSAIVEREAKIKVHVITGNLRRSLTVIKKIESPNRVECQIGSTVPYAAAEEFRVDSRGSHAYLRPALDENEAQIQAAIESSIAKALGAFR